MTPEALADLIRSTLVSLVASGDITLDDDDIPTTVHVERPRQREHGDWATNLAMKLAKTVGMNPRQFAEVLAPQLAAHEGITTAEVAGPGFINIRLAAGAAGQLARTIVEAGDSYGRVEANGGPRVNLEFVSANPTGPIHIAGARWAAVGDALARILEAAGGNVTREYYFNDHGAQIDRFARSLLARARNQAAPDDGYAGQYITDIAAAVVAGAVERGQPDPTTLDDDAAQEHFRSHGVALMFEEIKQSLAAFRVDFDVYFHEDSLYAEGAVEKALDHLTEAGHMFDQDGARWLRTSAFGDDKDRVVVKSDGEAAYIAGDIAYYLNKRERGFDENIIMLGADHHGYVGRMMAMCAAFGDEPGRNLQLLIGQMVNLVSDDGPVRMSKRAGTVVTLEDLVDAVGVDAARYALVRSSMDSNLDINLDQLRLKSNDNPVYYVQYAHARISAVARNADSHGVRRQDGFDPSLLNTAADADLLGVLGRYPAIIRQASELREPHRVARYLEEIAGVFHQWYGQVRVSPRGDDTVTDTHRSRLWLAEAARQVLASGLDLLGVSAPDRM